MKSDTIIFYLILVFLLSSFIITIAPYYYKTKSNYKIKENIKEKNKNQNKNIKKYIGIFCIERSGSTW